MFGHSSKNESLVKLPPILALLAVFVVNSGCNSPKQPGGVTQELDTQFYKQQIESAYQGSDFERADSLIVIFYALADSLSDNKLTAAIALEESFIRLIQNRYEEVEYILITYRDMILNSGTSRMRMNWYSRMASMLSVTNRGMLALQVLDEVRDEAEQSDDIEIKTGFYSTKSIVLKELHRLPEALESYYTVIRLMKDNDMLNANLATLYNNVGLILHETGRIEEALESYAQAYELNMMLQNRLGLASNLNNMSNSLKALGQYQAAIDSLRGAIQIHEEQPPSPFIVRNYYNMGILLADNGQHEAAYDYFERGYNLSLNARFPAGLMFHAFGLSGYYEAIGDTRSVIRWAEESLEIAQMLQNLTIQADTWGRLAGAHESLGRFESALIAQKNFQVFSDSINVINSQENIERIRSEFQFDIIEAENDLLRRELDFSSRQNNTQLVILILTVIGVIITAGLLALVVRQKKVIVTKNKDLHELIQTRDALVGAIVHDLRSPLSSLLSSLEIIREELPDNDDSSQIMEIAEASGEKLREMINGLLDISGIEKADIRSNLYQTDVKAVVEQTLRAYNKAAAMKQISIETSIVSLKAISHGEYLGRIADNLISNAIKFSPIGGQITVGIYLHDKHWELWVKDTGDGFTDKDKEQAFQLFQKLSTRPTNNEPSTGLGLYIVRMLADKLGGRVNIESEKGNGATVRCQFPL
jgi:signal transduction histidine kinase/Tfp pilus assembly protein PilF